jgi:uncharacterized membrane protein (UPF0127 family)
MRRVKVINRSQGSILATDAGLANGLFTRFAGLMLRKGLPAGGGLVLMPEGQIHMFFMRFPLDVIHADAQGNVLRLLHGIKPWHVGPRVRKARMVIELPEGAIARSGTTVGDVITLEDIDG